jgi:hypothetical protein
MLERFDAVEGLDDFEAGAFEGGPVIEPHESRIVDDQNTFRHVFSHASHLIGL